MYCDNSNEKCFVRCFLFNNENCLLFFSFLLKPFTIPSSTFIPVVDAKINHIEKDGIQKFL